MKSSISLKDIAETAGVSVSTVSQALRGGGRMRENTRERVRSAADTLGYSPNLTAQELRYGVRREIGIILGNNDEVQMEKALSFERCMRENDYSVQLQFSPEGTFDLEGDQDLLQNALLRRPALIALFPDTSIPPEYVKHACERANTPYIIVDPIDSCYENLNAVYVDRASGIYTGAMHLAEAGCKRIAYVGYDNTPHNRERMDGYTMAMLNLNREPQIFRGSNEWQNYRSGREVFINSLNDDGKAVARELLALKEMPDGIQVFNDLMAAGLMNELMRHGVKIPEDVKIVGFDNRGICQLLNTPLSSIATPNRELGEAAAEIVLEQLSESVEPSNGRSRILKPELLVRRSSSGFEGGN